MLKNDFKKNSLIGFGSGSSAILNGFVLVIHYVHQVSSKSVLSFLRYRATYRFWPYLSMVKNHLKNYSIQIWIQIFIKIESLCPCHTPNLSRKFHPNPSITFEISCKQTDEHTNSQMGENLTSVHFWWRR